MVPVVGRDSGGGVRTSVRERPMSPELFNQAEIFEDLAAELDRLEEVLDQLSPEQWTSASAAPGWSVSDVVLHLAQTEEFVVASLSAAINPVPRATTGWASVSTPGLATPGSATPGSATPGSATMDSAMGELVAAERSSASDTLQRWKAARRAALASLRHADPLASFPWAAAPLRPAVLAATRLAEHWAHAQDIVEPLAIDLPDTDRLRHVAWLGHRTLPYALGLRGMEARPLRAVLVGPTGRTFTYGPPEAASTISGELVAFCRVGAQRLQAEASGLDCSDTFAVEALRALRNYAA